MKKVALLLGLVTLISCQKDPIKIEKEGNITLHLLFEKDGCKMYRFNDGGHNVYWCNCEGGTSQDYQAGKNNHVTERTITTNN